MIREELYKKAVVYLVGLLCLLTPSIAIPRYFFPFIFPKIIFASFVIQVIFIVYLVYVINQKKLEFNLKKAVILFLFYVIWIMVSIFLGVDSYNSLWGNAERMEGFYFLFNFFLLFLILSQIFYEEIVRIIILRFFLFGSLLTFIYALLQLAKVNSSLILQDAMPFSSSLGNPALFATYLIFPFWFAIYLWVIDKNKQWRIFYITVALLSFIFAFSTQSRATFFGILIGLVVSAVLFSFTFSNRNIRKYLFGFCLTVFFLLVFTFLFRNSDFIKKIPMISDIAAIGFNDRTTASRIVSAKISLVGLKERPVFGWGHNNFFYLYAKYYDPQNLTNDPQFFDKPHNKYFEVLTETGIIGLILYLVFIGYLIKVLWRDLSPVTIVILGMLVSYLFQNIFIFDTPSTYVGLTILLALVAIYDKTYKTLIFPIKKTTQLASGVVIVFCVVYILSLFYYLGMNAQSIKILAVVPQKINEPKIIEQVLNNFFGRQTFLNREILINLANQISVQVQPTSQNVESLKAIYEELKYDFDKRPNNYRLGVSLLKILSMLSLADKAYADLYIQYMPKVIELAPGRPEGYYENGLFFFRTGDINKAKEEYLKAINLNQKYVPPLWYLGVVLFLAEDYNESKVYLEKALEKGFNYKSTQGLAVLVELYVKLNDLEKAGRYLDEAKKLFPEAFKNVVLPKK